MKDYFAILGVERGSSEAEMRAAYRGLAMRYHPDRNPDDPLAEERFKEIAEAYGVLSDPVKRAVYLRCAAREVHGASAAGAGGSENFHYSQEDILRDLCSDPRFQQMLQGLLAEFSRSGFRMNSQFLRKTFFGQGRGWIMGGVFFFGTMGGASLLGKGGKMVSRHGPGLLQGVARAWRGMLRGRETAPTRLALPDADIIYHLRLTVAEFQEGKWLQVQVPGSEGQETLRVHVPPGSRAGQRLRLKGKGQTLNGSRGDLYLYLESD